MGFTWVYCEVYMNKVIRIKKISIEDYNKLVAAGYIVCIVG